MNLECLKIQAYNGSCGVAGEYLQFAIDIRPLQRKAVPFINLSLVVLGLYKIHIFTSIALGVFSALRLQRYRLCPP